MFNYPHTQEILVHDWLNSSKIDLSSNILVATSTEPQPTYSSNSYDETAVETKTRVNILNTWFFQQGKWYSIPLYFTEEAK